MELLSEDINDFWTQNGSSVKVLEDPSAIEFLREAVSIYQPVIIRGLIADWPAISEWNLGTICEKLGDSSKLLKVNVTAHGDADSIQDVLIDNNLESESNPVSEKTFVYPLECTMTTSVFHDMMTSPLIDDAVPYLSLQNDNLRVDMPELMKDMSPSLKIAEDAFGQTQPEAG